jgi:hypothetical protein
VSGWDELVSVALLGTARRDPPSLADPELPAPAADATAEERLLVAAGAITVYRRAGRRAASAPALPGSAPNETRMYCSDSAASRCMLLLDDRRALLPEWLRAVAARELVLPPEHLPDLLEAATASPALQGLVDAVLGERGRWLALQEARWAWAAALPASDEERERVWSTGERPERRRLVAQLRREQPARARELLEQGWRKESGEDRAWFLATLADGLSPGDESLLERALDDRREDVRGTAARLLSRLPSSAFAQRMRERVRPLVRLEGDRRARVQVSLPEQIDHASARDGIALTPPQGVGERAWWLEQLIGSTPLAFWEEAGLAPEQGLEGFASGELERPVRNGLVRAARAQGDPRWASALVGIDARLAAHLAPQDAAAAALAHLRAGARTVAEVLPAPWPRDLSEQAIGELVQLVAGGGDRHGPRLIAERIDPALTDEAERRLSALDPGPAQDRQIEEILRTLSFRRDMYEELR